MKHLKSTVGILALSLVLLLSACGGKGNAPKDPSEILGQWKQTNSNSKDTFHGAVITDDTIEIYWVSDGGDTRSLYWAGSYVAPENLDSEYTWDSENDHDKTGMGWLASSDDTKTFTYKDGVISYEASALGSTTTVKLEKEDWGFPG